MFINLFLERFQSSRIANFIKDSLFYKNIDKIAFAFLCLTIVSTTFLSSTYVGLLALCFSFCCILKCFLGDRIKISFINKVLIVYFLFVIISQAGATLFIPSLKGLIKTIVYLTFYFSACFFLAQNKKRIFPIIFLIASLISFESIIAIIQNISHVEAIATWQDYTNVSDATKVISRAYGTLKPYNPNLLAGYLLCGLSSFLALFGFCFFKKYIKTSILFLSFFLITIFGIFVTGSRGAYLGLFGFIAALFCFALFYVKRKYGSIKIKMKYKLTLGAFFALMAGIVCLVPSFLERILSIFSFRKDSSISFRMNVYEACFNMLSDNKFLGIGVGNKNFREIYGLYMKTGYDALGAYSVPLEIAVESGVFAFLAFFFFILLVCIRCVKYILLKNAHPYRKIAIASVFLTIVGVMFHGLFDTIFFRPQVQIIFWINVAIFHSLTVKNKFCNK